MIWLVLMFVICSFFVVLFNVKNNMWLVELEMLYSGFSVLSFSLVLDFFSTCFFFVVLIISASVFWFAAYYMDKEKNQKGFFFILGLFVMSMSFLIFSPNIFSLLLGWDGLGVVSYLLVVFYMNSSSANAGMLTFMLNRLGDLFFLFSLALVFFVCSWDFMNMKMQTSLLGMFLLLTFITKSAQVPFSSWLPAAMAAPTPVSSLVHSSTLVTAGLFLMLRFVNVVVIFSSFLLLMAGMTCFLAGMVASFEWDLKKIIAYSTLSQLGFMVFSFSLGLFFFCFFHLVCHAFFKASLFLSSGVLIHNNDSGQDFRSVLPIGWGFSLSLSSLVCIMCLCGFPFISGFFSKDSILDGTSLSFFFFFSVMVTVSLTFLYSFRFSFYSYIGLNTLRVLDLKMYDYLVYIVCPVWLLSFFGIFFGFVWGEVMVSFLCSSVLISDLWKTTYLFFFFLFFFFVWKFCMCITKVYKKNYFFSGMWFLKFILGYGVGKGLFKKSYMQNGFISAGWADFVGSQGSFEIMSKLSFFFLRDLAWSFFFFFFFWGMLVMMYM